MDVEGRAKTPPRIHDLARLAEEVRDGGDPRFGEEMEFLAELSDLCTRARYAHPDWKATIAFLERPETAQRLLGRTEEIYRWLRSKLAR